MAAEKKKLNIPSGIWPEPGHISNNLLTFFSPLPPHLSLFVLQKNLASKPKKMFLRETSPPLSQSAGFLNKFTILCPNHLSFTLLACPVASSMRKD